MKALWYSLFLILLVTGPVRAQKILSEQKKALKLFEQGQKLRQERDFAGAIARYNAAIQKDSAFAEAYLQAGGAYSVLQENEKALEYYAALVKRYPENERYAGAHLKIAEAALKAGNYHKARAHAEKYIELRPAKNKYSQQAATIISNSEYALGRINQPLAFNPRPLAYPLNQFRQQYFPVLSADQSELFFIKREKSEEIYTSTRLPNGSWSVPVPIDSAITSEYNEGTCTVSADGRTLVFTSCMRNDGYGSCDLYITRKRNGRWSTPVNIGQPVNTSAWDSQPALSADAHTLYYVSNRKGGLGNRDIWVTHYNEETGWSMPRNLGPVINTPEDDISPFIHVNDRTLYFSSNGRTGFGGFDIYYAELDSLQRWQTPRNFGYPINTHNDELAMVISADGTKGYYSHEFNRGGELISKLYEIDIPQEISVKFRSSFVTGVIYDSLTRAPVAATVRLVNLNANNVVRTVISDSHTGKYLMVLTEGSAYALYVTAPGYLLQSYHFDMGVDSVGFEGVRANIALKPLKSGEKTILNNVFFDFDSFTLTEKSQKALRYVVEFLKTNPEISIEVAGHTDNVGTATYNMELSERRAYAVFTYFTKEGVNPDRLSFRGYGASRPLATNETETGRAKNRRIELFILE